MKAILLVLALFSLWAEEPALTEVETRTLVLKAKAQGIPDPVQVAITTQIIDDRYRVKDIRYTIELVPLEDWIRNHPKRFESDIKEYQQRGFISHVVSIYDFYL